MFAWITAAVLAAVFSAMLVHSHRGSNRLRRRLEELQREIGVRECVERQLQASQSNLQMATESSGVGTWYWDLERDEVSCSEQAARLFGLDPSQRSFQGKDFIAIVHPDDQDRMRPLIENAFGEGGQFQIDYRILRRDGTSVWLSITGRGLRDSDGEVRRVAGITADVSDRKRLEENFYQAQKMEAVGRLAGGVAHDFNNMLGVISAYAELLMEEPVLSARGTKRVSEIMNATKRANSLTRQLLAFSRKTVIQPTVLDLNSVVLGVKDMVQRLVGEDIRVTSNLAQSLPSIHMDKGQLEQVLLNFAANSRDAMPRGGRLEFTTSLVQERSASDRPIAGDCVLLEVTDVGCGMTADVMKHVFEPFFTTKAAGRGTGLGLATVYGVIEQAHGAVKVESTVGVGTTFRVYLPATSAPASTESATPRAAEVASTARVLLVEDEPSLREVLTQFMEAAGMHVLSASGGREALAKIDTGESIDVLLTDLVMPEMDGRTLAQIARVKCPKLHVIYMSGHTDDTLMQKELLTEGLGYLQKPFSRSDLMKTIDATMRPVA